MMIISGSCGSNEFIQRLWMIQKLFRLKLNHELSSELFHIIKRKSPLIRRQMISVSRDWKERASWTELAYGSPQGTENFKSISDVERCGAELIKDL